MPPVPPPPRLLVVTIDRLPAWMLSAWGSTWVATPAIDALAARGVVFDRLVTPSTDPRDAIRDLLAGPAGRLAAGGGRSIAVVTDDPAVVEGHPFGRGIGPERVAEVRRVATRADGGVERDESRTNLARLFAGAVEVVAAAGAAGDDGPRMVWCHAGSLGVAWDAPESFRDAYVDPEDPPPALAGGLPNFAVGPDTDPDVVVGVRQVFAGQLTLLDRHLGRLLAAVGCGPAADGGRDQRGGGWIVLVAGVRGLPLGLHGWVGCRDDLPPYGEVVHVPAILAAPAAHGGGQRYGGLVVPADLGATLAEMIAGERRPESPPGDASAPGPWLGRSLVELLDSWSVSPRDRVVIDGAGGAALVTPGWHLVLDGGREGAGPRPRLYVKPDDFFELTDVADRCPGVADELGRALAAGGAEAWQAPLSAAAVEGV